MVSYLKNMIEVPTEQRHQVVQRWKTWRTLRMNKEKRILRPCRTHIREKGSKWCTPVPVPGKGLFKKWTSDKTS